MILDERRIEALVVAMALAPGVYVRNRMFDFYKKTGAQKARARASALRGIVPQLARAGTLSISLDEAPRHTASGDPTFVLRYQIPAIRLSRVVELSATELSALRLLAAKAKLSCLPATDDDRIRVDAALNRLFDFGDLAQAAHDATLA